MSKSPQFTAEIITDRPPRIAHQPVSGYGKGATATMLVGRVMSITIKRDDQLAIVIDIDDKGHVHLINCEGMYEHLFGATVRLKTTRPWA